jgi:hypothetical protein
MLALALSISSAAAAEGPSQQQQLCSPTLLPPASVSSSASTQEAGSSQATTRPAMWLPQPSSAQQPIKQVNFLFYVDFFPEVLDRYKNQTPSHHHYSYIFPLVRYTDINFHAAFLHLFYPILYIFCHFNFMYFSFSLQTTSADLSLPQAVYLFFLTC